MLHSFVQGPKIRIGGPFSLKFDQIPIIKSQFRPTEKALNDLFEWICFCAVQPIRLRKKW